MGAQTDGRIYETDSTYEARQQFMSDVEQARHENGHGGYTGTIAEHSDFTFVNKLFRSLDEGHEYIENEVEKYQTVVLAIELSADKTVTMIGGLYPE